MEGRLHRAWGLAGIRPPRGPISLLAPRRAPLRSESIGIAGSGMQPGRSGPPRATTSVPMEIVVGYRRYARVLKWLTVSLLAYPITAFLVPEPRDIILRATFVGKNEPGQLHAVNCRLRSPDLAFKPRGRASRTLAASANQDLMPITMRGRLVAVNPRK